MQTVSMEAISSSENFQIAADNVLNNDFLNSAIYNGYFLGDVDNFFSLLV